MAAIIITHEIIISISKYDTEELLKKASSIYVKGSKMWNSLSPDIKLSRNVNLLKSSLLGNYKF